MGVGAGKEGDPEWCATPSGANTCVHTLPLTNLEPKTTPSRFMSTVAELQINTNRGPSPVQTDSFAPAASSRPLSPPLYYSFPDLLLHVAWLARAASASRRPSGSHRRRRPSSSWVATTPPPASAAAKPSASILLPSSRNPDRSPAMAKLDINLYKLQLIYRHAISPSLILKILLFSAAITAVPFLASLYLPDGQALSSPSVIPLQDLTAAILDLSLRGYIPSRCRLLCIGRGGSGRAAAAAMRRLGFSAAAKGVEVEDVFGGRLPFGKAAFDFVLAAGLDGDGAGAPARVVLEMERVLRPGRIGAVLTAGRVMKAAAPVTALLRVSDVVAVRRVNGTAAPLAVVVFRKRRMRLQAAL